MEKNDVIGDMLLKYKKTWLSSLFLASISKPKIINTLKYRMHSPDFFNQCIVSQFSLECVIIKEHYGKSWDWEIMGKKISVKSMQSNIFGHRKNTKIGQPIQLKNTKENIVLHDGEFDYLLICISTKKDQYGMYLLSFSKVKELLSQSFLYNKKCDKNGYDGKGQIKLYVPNKSCCVEYVEMDQVMLKNLRKKYNCEISIEKRNEIWSSGIFRCVKDQLELSKITGEV